MNSRKKKRLPAFVSFHQAYAVKGMVVLCTRSALPNLTLYLDKHRRKQVMLTTKYCRAIYTMNVTGQRDLLWIPACTRVAVAVSVDSCLGLGWWGVIVRHVHETNHPARETEEWGEEKESEKKEREAPQKKLEVLEMAEDVWRDEEKLGNQRFADCLPWVHRQF